MLTSLPQGSTAVVIGATGAIGGAVADGLEKGFDVVRLSRRSEPPLDLTDETTIEAAAAALRGRDVRCVFVATGFLHGDGAKGPIEPEKSLRRLTPEALTRNLALNTIGPALVLKHFCPLLPREGRSLMGMVTAKVGSIADNELGGWYSYRASKAAQNQLLRTAAIEVARTKPEAVLVALHPGTVASDLSEPFAKSGLTVRPPAESAEAMLRVLDGASETGTFRGYDGAVIPW